MRITLLANNDLPACLALNLLWPALAAEHELSLILSSRVGRAAHRPPALERLAFFEQGLFTDILFPRLDAAAPVTAELKTFTRLAADAGASIRVLNRINQGEDHAVFAAGVPDLVLSIRYGVILRRQVLAVPRCGVLNLHSGLLPDYQGVMATFRALLAGDERLGTTLHYIDDDRVDTGPVVATSSLPVRPGASYLWHVLALYEAGCANVVRAVEAIAAGATPQAVPQRGAGRYFSFPDEAELTTFTAMGLQLATAADVVPVAARFGIPPAQTKAAIRDGIGGGGSVE